MATEKVLEVKNLEISFKTDSGILKAVRDVSFDLIKGETLCIVGESGSGKSVTSKAIMGILAHNAIVEGGNILYQGEDLLKVSEEEFHRIRGHKIGMIFQDPLSSLNPIVRIGKQITEATLLNGNKLKLRYNDLIINALTRYRNKVVQQKISIEKAKHVAKTKIEELQAKITINKNSEDIKPYSNEIKQIKATLKADIAKIKQDNVEHLALYKNELSEAKKEAKKDVKAFKKEILNQFKVKYRETKEKRDKSLVKASLKYKEYLKNNPKVSNEEKKATKKELFKEAEAFAKELKQIKEDRINALKVTKKEAKAQALQIMREVGIPEPERRFSQYPFEFSGGMRQRIVIAIALTASPDILICDEPTTALDVTIQAQILELVNKLKEERKLSCIFITHDLGVVANMADRVAVMYAGKIVEYGTAYEVFFEPKHPYTWALLASIPDVESKERLDAIPGTPPNLVYPPKGDAFAARSKYAMEIDYKYEPPLFKLSDTHYAATWLLHEDAPKVQMPKIVSERIKLALEEAKNE